MIKWLWTVWYGYNVKAMRILDVCVYVCVCACVSVMYMFTHSCQSKG